ncbi:MAG: HepT-like ribonuclease domain-containing protein [Actinomycetes bacterium]
MERNVAKELLHIETWLDRVDEIVHRGHRAYLSDDLLQEAGDSLMMKLGEAASRLSRMSLLAPRGVEWATAIANRNFLIHQYDEINREMTWLTLARDLPAWKKSLRLLFDEARAATESGAD